MIGAVIVSRPAPAGHAPAVRATNTTASRPQLLLFRRAPCVNLARHRPSGALYRLRNRAHGAPTGRIRPDQCGVANPDGVVAETVGDASDVSGAVGEVVVVTVCPVVMAGGSTRCSAPAEASAHPDPEHRRG